MITTKNSPHADAFIKDGVLLFNKPPNLTSAKTVDLIKQKLGIKKAGHCGTLDPFAVGLLIVCFGKATKIARYLCNLSKEYIGQVQFGEERDSFDITGIVTNKNDTKLNINTLESILPLFIGDIYQTPPAFSAIKLNGRRSYSYARAGVPISLAPRKVSIYKCSIQSLEDNRATIKVHCSKGTYVRSLACDMGKATGALAYLHSLKRISIGSFSLFSNKVLSIDSSLDDYKNNALSIEKTLSFLPSIVVDDKTKKEISFGKPINTKIEMPSEEQSEYAVKDKEGNILAIVDNKLKYLNVFA